MKTYNIPLQFNSQLEEDFWKDLLENQKSICNEMYTIIFDKKPILAMKVFHDTLYSHFKKLYPEVPSQFIIKSEQEVLSTFKAIKSNKHKLDSAPEKKKLSLRLDKRLYSKFTKDSIFLISPIKNKRTEVKLNLYPKVEELFSLYKTFDPLIFYRNGKFYLSVSFDIPEPPLKNQEALGVDLGVRRLFVTSDGIALSGKEYQKHKRRIRYNKRCLQSKKTKSSKKHLKKLSKKETNFSKNYIHHVANEILKTDKSIIVFEDLTKIKQNTSKRENGTKRKSHNRNLGQIPFFLLKQITTYKALHIGKSVVTVNPSFTSQINSQTGKKEGERKGCRFYSENLVYDADWNASINIRNKYLKLPTLSKVPIDGKLDFVGRLLSTNQSVGEKFPINPNPSWVG